MPRTEYQDRLETLRDDVVGMGRLVLDRYAAAIQAIETADGELGHDVIRGDDEINQRYLDIESDCVELLALQQPVAGDLRFIAASFKIITDIERIGDLATNLGRLATELEGELHPAVELRAISEPAIEMVEDSLKAYEAEDANACYRIAEQDDELDAACERASERIVRALIEEVPDTTNPEALVAEASEGLIAIRDLERVGDHAVNISARTLYMVENDESLIY